MTISTEVRKAGPFIGNDSASVFPFAFKVFKAADLIVVRRQDNIGEETTLVLDSDYHVTLNSNQDTTPGGVVTLVAGALASGFTLVVSSELPYLQPTDLTNQGGFYPKVITNALDRLTIFSQQLAEITERTLKLPITAPTNISAEIPLPNPSELIAWNETGTGLTTVSPQSLVTSIAYGSATADLFAGDGVTTTFPLSTNPASVNNLDVSIDGHSQRPVQGGIGDYSWNGGASITFASPPPAPSSPGDKNVLVRYMQAIPVSDSEALHAQTREALRRSYADAGYNLVDGSFETGGTLTSTADVLLLESAGTAYAWTGAYPGGGYDVAPGIDPTVVPGFALRTDVVLRDELQPWRDDHLLLADYLALDGVTDDTAALNELTKTAISKGVAVDLGTGKTARVLNAYLNNYTLGQAVSGSGQREHVRSFVGRGGKVLCPTFKATDTATSDDYVLIGNNSVGVVVGGFRVHGNGLSKGADLSFIGTAGGTAPSNGNEISNIWCENFVGVGLNLDQCNDTDIHGIFTRNSSGTLSSVAVSLQGAGGFMSLRDSVIYGGRLRMACQNGSLRNIVMAGLELSGASYNTVAISSCHFIGMDTNSYAINSTAGGNATRAIEVDSCYFPTLLSTGYIQGRFYRGGKFTNCHFRSSIITSNISAASSGRRPVFVFENCTFETTPTFDEVNSIAICINCTGPTGAPYDYQSDVAGRTDWIRGLSIGPSIKHSTESFSNNGGGWSRFSSNTSGVTPQNALGAYLGSNKSSGRGEVDFVYNKGSGSLAGIDFADMSTGSYVVQWQMKNASFGPANDNTQSAGTAGTRYSVVYSGTGAINTSDAREKSAPLPVDDVVLDAWGDVQLVAFQWLSSIAQKGDSARWHFGVIAQQVRDAFIARGLDGTKYGLLCYDEWDAEYEPVIVSEVVDGEIVSKETGEVRLVREAGNRWGIRCDQCLFVEAAYQRRRCDRIEARLNAAGL